MQPTHSGAKRPPPAARAQAPTPDARPSAKRRHPAAAPCAPQRERRHTSSEGADRGSGSDSDTARMRDAVTQLHNSLLPPPAPAPPSLYDRALHEMRLSSDASLALRGVKPRKPTHVVRKEEKEELEKQLETLKAELLGLKYRAMFPHLRTSGKGGVNPQSAGDVLRDAIKVQQLSLASVQAMLSGYVRQHRVSPIQTPIRLGRDPAQRKATLQALKDGKVAEATRFLAERTRGLDRTKLFFEEERFETDAGDFCVVQCDITPLPRARNVKELFDVLFYFIFNVEIKITETLGSITVREDDESGDEGVSHHRLASRTQFGVPTEISTVHFSDFREPSADNMFLGSGTIVADFVDEDELYPYRPRERVRRDLTAVLTITPERRRGQRRAANARGSDGDRDGDGDNGDDDGVVVVLTRWMTIRSHRAQFPVGDEAAQHLQSTLGNWTDEMLKALRQKAAARGPACAPQGI